MILSRKNSTFPLILLLSVAMLVMFGCSEDTPMAPETSGDDFFPDGDPFTQAQDKGIGLDIQDGSFTPADQVTVDCFGNSFTFWPFTSAKLNGEPMDPVNIVFAGHADPIQIRAALMALDGDRTVVGFPNAYPFDQVWKDAISGGVQSNYAAEGKWQGSVIQLTLGEYQPIRFHLRLFRTEAKTADGLPITIGAAHFEVLIPGTTDHQVLSWNLARDIVVADMMRTGLLDPGQHLRPTGQITPAPGFRTIMTAVYNELPPDLLGIIGGPPPPVSEPVDIPNDGVAMMVYLAAPAPVVPGEFSSTTAVEFGQFVPRPYCNEGPADWLWIEGTVDFHNTTRVDRWGRYSYVSGYEGLLTAVPVDISTGQPAGEPFTADVKGRQRGYMGKYGSRVRGFDKKVTNEAGGPQIEFIDLKLTQRGRDRYRNFTLCLDEE